MVSAAVRNLLWLPPYPQDSGNLVYMIAFLGCGCSLRARELSVLLNSRRFRLGASPGCEELNAQRVR